MPYRLYRRDPVIAGKYYLGVDCKECSRPIYTIDLKNGHKPEIHGDGEISTPCRRCGCDDFYPATALKVIQAVEDMSGTRPPRIKISNSQRKSLSKTFPNAKATFGVGFIEDRPQAAVIVARIITSWADVEVQCARLLAELMETSIPTAAAVFGSLKSSRAQNDALNAAALISLDDKDYELFCAHMARKNSLEKERNDLAHGCFGVAVTVPDGIVWASQSDFLTFMASYEHDPKASEKFRRKQFVYEFSILERIAQEVEELHGQIGNFKGYLFSRRDPISAANFRPQRYRELCEQPHISQALSENRAAKKGRSI